MMKSPPLHPHHTATAAHKLLNNHIHHHLNHDTVSQKQQQQTPPNSPLPTSSSSSSAATAASSISNQSGGTSLLLLNKHQLNNYNFHDYFDKLNSSLGSGCTGTSSPTPQLTLNNTKSVNHHLMGHLSGIGGGKKREHTPNQSTDELQLQINSYLNPVYEDFGNSSNGSNRLKISNNSSGIMDAQKRQKLIKFSNSALDAMQQQSPFLASSSAETVSTINNSKSNQQKQLQSALHFTSEIEKELSNLTLSIEKDLERQQYQNQQQNEYYGNCAKCSKPVVGRTEACQAMNQIYHGSCFVCMSCGRSLRAKPFYFLNNQVYCEEDYLYSGFLENAEKCDACGHIIADMILQAMGKSYHPGCFRCFSCNECLDGVPFTLDINNRVYCIKDYYKIYAPKCSACGLSITPAEGTNETIRIVAMEKDFHMECYVCEKCGVQLGDEPERRCYPFGKSLLCHTCHVKQVEMSQLDPFMSSFTSSNVKSVFPSTAAATVAAARANDFIYSPNNLIGNTRNISTPAAVIKKNIQTENL